MGSQHHILKETTDSLVELLTATFKDAGYKRVNMIVEAPKPDAIEGKLPAVCLYLYQIAPDWDGTARGAYIGDTVRRYRAPSGKIIEVVQHAPAWVRLEYLVSCWAQTPEDEQLLLGLAVKVLASRTVLQGKQLKGESFPEGYDVPIGLDGKIDEGTSARFWGSLNQPIRPALSLWTIVPVMSDEETPFRRVEERVIGYEGIGEELGKETGPEGNIDVPPEGTFVKRLK